jgi:hypothetical protein
LIADRHYLGNLVRMIVAVTNIDDIHGYMACRTDFYGRLAPNLVELVHAGDQRDAIPSRSPGDRP